MLPIVFGFPMPEMLEAAERGEIALGGCVVTGEDPTHQCSACGSDVIVDALATVGSKWCATCGLMLDGDWDDEPDGDAGRPICGDCNRNREFAAIKRSSLGRRDRMTSDTGPQATISLLNERDGPNSWFIDASLDEQGNLLIAGQDIGPATATMSSDGEYEWSVVVPASSLGRAVVVLGGRAGEPILELLARDYSGRAAYGIRRKLEEAGIPVELFTWSG